MKIDIWPQGSVEHQFNQTTIVAYNDGTGTPERGNYRAWIVPPEVAEDGDEVVKRWALDQRMGFHRGARVVNFPRGHDQHHLPALTAAIIRALGCEEFLAA